MKVPTELLSHLIGKNDFFIATHINPEGDALGSSLALSAALETMGKKTILYDRDGVPDFYSFLPGQERFIQTVQGIQTSSLNLVLLDCNTPERAGIEGVSFKSSIVIDHHETETDFGDTRWIKPKAAATGLMIFYIIKELGVELTKEIAVNLYTAIAIDTGTFRFGDTTAEVLSVASELAEAGARPGYIANNLYETWSGKRFSLLVMALNTLEIKNSIAFTYVDKKMYKKTGAGPEDTENFSGFPRMMQDIRISAFFRETGDNEWKVSLRSRGEVNVARIAELFKGGGHKNAAGYKVKAPLESAKELLLKSVAQLQVFQI
jgi:bifunctional oligoribonuclease and PAP phosphatase NrnA